MTRLKINHKPHQYIDTVIEHYTKKDGVPIKYVATTAINSGAAFAMDVFYRDTPHPEFGNRYFGLYRNWSTLELMITNADNIENLDFDMIEVDGVLHYSQHRHDYNQVGPVAIDGGRCYMRLVGNDLGSVKKRHLKVKDGEFVERKDETEQE